MHIAGKVMSKWVSAQPTKDKPPLGLRHSQSEVAANTCGYLLATMLAHAGYQNSQTRKALLLECTQLHTYI